jgi:ComF family protein
MHALQSISALLFPPGCCLCEVSLANLQQVLCAPCRRDLQIQAWISKLATGGRRSALDCCAAASFAAPLDKSIHRFKYPASGLACLTPGPKQLLAHLICEAARQADHQLPEAILPIPLHPKRLHQRGFNPACVLARALSRHYGLPCLPTALTRIRDTPSQTGLGRPARRANVKGAFAYRGRQPAPKSVWLVDDVVTTGATTEEATRVLRKAGVKKVTVICVARTPSQRGPTLRAAPCAGAPDRRVF